MEGENKKHRAERHRRIPQKRLAAVVALRACPGVTDEVVRDLDPEAYQWWVDTLGAVPAPRDGVSGGRSPETPEVGNVSRSQ